MVLLETYELFAIDWVYKSIEIIMFRIHLEEEWTMKFIELIFDRFFSVWFYSFSVIVAFATNYLLQQGVENATTTARYGVYDTQAFLRSTSEQSNHILVKNYDELDSHLKLMLMGK